MPIDARIPLGFQMPNLMTPNQAQQEAMSLQALQQQAQMRSMEIQKGMNSMRDQNELSALAADPSNIDKATGGFTPEAIAKISNPAVRQKINQSRMDTLYKQKEIDWKASEEGQLADKRKTEALHGVMESAYSTYEDVLQKTSDPKIATEAFQQAQAAGYQEIKETGRGGFAKDVQFKMLSPDEVGRKLISHKERVEEENKRRTQERGDETPLIKSQNRRDKLVSELADLSPNDPQSAIKKRDISELDQYIKRVDMPPSAYGEKIPSGYRKTSDGNLEPIPGGPADSAKTGFSGEGMAVAGLKNLFFGEEIKGMGRDATAQRAKARELGVQAGKAMGLSNMEMAMLPHDNKAKYKAIDGLVKWGAFVEKSEVNLAKDLEVVADYAEKLSESDIKKVNSLIVAGKSEFGSGPAQAYGLAVQKVKSEYMRLQTGPTSNAMLPVEASKKSDELISTGISSKNWRGDIKDVMLREAKNTKDSVDEVKNTLRNSVTGSKAGGDFPSIDKATQNSRDVEAGRQRVQEEGGIEKAKESLKALDSALKVSKGDARNLLQAEHDMLKAGIDAIEKKPSQASALPAGWTVKVQ